MPGSVVSVGELIEVGTGLSIVVFAVLGVRQDWARREDEGDEKEPGS